MNNKYQELIKILGEEKVKIDEPLSKYTTFKIGGPADLFYESLNEEELINSVELAFEKAVPFFILGTGSNVLIGDKGFRGLVIKTKNKELKTEKLTDRFKVYAEAGVLISVLLGETIKKSISGLEFMAGIPGMVGGAVRGNAGAWRENIGDFVNRVKILSLNGEVLWIEKKNCSFSYRDSRFKNNHEIILGVEFFLNAGDQLTISQKIQENLKKRENQPNEPSAGCIFVNPKPQSAGDLIEKCGLKNAQSGQAKISEKHANFIINLGGAKAVDVEKLINLVKKEVKDKFGVELIEEIVKIGEF